MATQQTAVTQYIVASDGVRYAYRRIGTSDGIPIIMHNFFRSNMDFWDPLLINSLAAQRPVILFDQAGVGRSGGTIPTTYQGWVDCQINLMKALGDEQFDVVGFSMGGMAAQLVAMTAPNLVRKLVLLGTMAAAPGHKSDVSGIVWPREDAPSGPIAALCEAPVSTEDTRNAVEFSFFCHSDAGRAAAQDWWQRVHERRVDNEPVLLELLGAEGTKRQLQAANNWTTPDLTDAYDRLSSLEMPVLVMNGDQDLLVPTSRSWELAVKIPRAQLVIYPKAGHGFLYQYAELTAAHINMFLDGFGDFDKLSRL